mmetsp:Transcript_7747/g.8857  ORF Transcript_7747/g.8857 Transcript_7747/m.8857 type:complete len:363 (+) Transcript_7747:77-1165(+)
MSEGIEECYSTEGSVGEIDYDLNSVAFSSALVGELVVDSPTTYCKHIIGVNHHNFINDNVKELLHDFESEGPSWMERGMIWWKKRKQKQEQEYLRKLAYEQRIKLLEAEHAGSISQLSDNSTFRQLTGKNFKDQESEFDEIFKYIRSSKSGSGISVEFEIEEEEVDFWTPETLIEEEFAESHSFCPYLLQQVQRQSIAKLGLPASLAYCRWKRIYSLARDGDSFNAFLKLVEGYHHTLLVIRTSNGEIIGGYADSEWKAQHQGNPEFYGSAQAFLFCVIGDEARVYNWTGVNRYIQFVDYKSKMLAFGGGGNVGAFGLCVADDFQKGSSGACATFGNEPLCSRGESFDIVDVECYGFLRGKF